MRTVKKVLLGVVGAIMTLGLCACVEQHPEQSARPNPGDAVKEEWRIVATSHSTLLICEKLDLELVAIPTLSGDVPERYEGLPTVGTPMSPDVEGISLLEPTDVIGPDTLAESIQPTYQAAGVPYTFIDLQSVEGMYDSIVALGEKYGAQEAAQALVAEYEDVLAGVDAAMEGEEAPRVLVLMGLPGAYIACTNNSYVGSLVELAGGENVVKVDTVENFVSWNTEALLALEPDLILLTAHGMPALAMEMFAKEFTTNDIWQHFRAVEQGQIFQLDHTLFGMSCSFDWPQAIEALQEIFHGESDQVFDVEAGLS